MTDFPSESHPIWLSPPHCNGRELSYIQDAIQSNWIAPAGPHIDHFEIELAQYLGEGHAIALNSGTAAIHLALVLLGVQPADEVLCQSFTFAATANPVIYQGATPIFVDSELNTWNMDPSMLEESIQDRIKKGKRPAACIVVHLYGMPAQIKTIRTVCSHYNIPLIEDAAEALGSSFEGQKVGTFGDFGIFSFNGNKIITTSGGGALISASRRAIEKARFYATQSKDPAPHYQHSEIGYNYRMSNVCAGIGRGQLEEIENRIHLRRRNFDFYKKELQLTLQDEPQGHFSNRWLSCALFNSYAEREKIRNQLLKNHIESRPLWKPLHCQPVFSKYPAYTNGVSEYLFEKGLCLPSGSNLSHRDLRRVKDAITAISVSDLFHQSPPEQRRLKSEVRSQQQMQKEAIAMSEKT